MLSGPDGVSHLRAPRRRIRDAPLAQGGLQMAAAAKAAVRARRRTATMKQDKSRRCASLRNYFATKTIFSLSMIAGGCDMTSFTMASRFSPDVGSNS